MSHSFDLSEHEYPVSRQYVAQSRAVAASRRTCVRRGAEGALHQPQHHHHPLGLQFGQEGAAAGSQRGAEPGQERLRRQQHVRLTDGKRRLQGLRAELKQRR